MPIPDAGATPRAWLALDLIAGLGGEGMRKLLMAYGTPEAVLSQSHANLSRIVGPRGADAIVNRETDAKFAPRLHAALEWLEGPYNHLLTLADADYPPALLQTADPPPLLYLKGRRALIGAPAIAIVGSRNATPGGVQNATAFAQSLSAMGYAIVSGLALGIDAAAHRGGLLEQGSTIAVVGTGLDLVYPARNKALAHDISERGLIVSEFSLGTPALPANFPRRNRIISGLSRGVLIVEATLNSGSLITARLAAEQGRDVFAIPGSIHSPFSKGAHLLIKQGAKLVDDAGDILSEFGGIRAASPSASPAPPTGNDRESEHADHALLAVMGYDAAGIDVLTQRTGLPAENVIAQLTALEIDGDIVSMPGGLYQRIN